MVYDQNGNVCALIKLETTSKGFTFDSGIMGIPKTMEGVGEIWIYVPHGTRHITIKHEVLGVLRDYYFPCAIEQGCTYIMQLVHGKVTTIVDEATTKQYLYISLDPEEANLEFDGKEVPTESGVFQSYLKFGKYKYRAYYKGYHDVVGVIEINDPTNAHELNLKLKPKFGYISILDNKQPEINGASVYIDDTHIGNIPIRQHQLQSGDHQIKITKDMYLHYKDTIRIVDEQHDILTPVLKRNFAEVTLKVVNNDKAKSMAKDATIKIDNEPAGLGVWSGRLKYGFHKIECAQQSHRTQKADIEITESHNNDTIILEAPLPIYGKLNITSALNRAQIYINNEHAGQTPKMFNKHLIGTYTIRVEAQGFEPQEKVVEVKEGEETKLDFKLVKKQVPTPEPEQTSVQTPVQTTVQTTSISSTSASQNTKPHQYTLQLGRLSSFKIFDKEIVRWEINDVYSHYLTCNGKYLIGVKQGFAQAWGYAANGDRLLFKFTIISDKVTLSPPTSSSSTVSSTSASKSYSMPVNRSFKSSNNGAKDFFDNKGYNIGLGASVEYDVDGETGLGAGLYWRLFKYNSAVNINIGAEYIYFIDYYSYFQFPIIFNWNYVQLTKTSLFIGAGCMPTTGDEKITYIIQTGVNLRHGDFKFSTYFGEYCLGMKLGYTYYF
jgi:hypothetical protein